VDVSLGIGDMDDVWHASIWGRNLTEAGPEYFQEFDTEPVGHHSLPMRRTYFATYGVQLQYNFR
jgi:hypothetical protein